MKNIFLFAQALAAKGGWRLINVDSLWTQVITQKYIAPFSIVDWIRNPRKSFAGGPVIWKALVKSFHILETSLAWDVGSGRKLRVGEDPWMGSVLQHLLPRRTVEALRKRGITFLSQLANPVRRRLGIQPWLLASTG